MITTLLALTTTGCGRLGFAPDGEAGTDAGVDAGPYVAGTAISCGIETTSTTSTSDVGVGGQPCTFGGTDDRERWLVIATANFIGSGQGAPAHLALEIDGVEHAWGEPATPGGQAWQVFTVVEGPAAQHEAWLRFNAAGGITSVVRSAWIIAVPLGPASHVQYAHVDGELVVVDPIDVAQLAFDAEPGEYVVLAATAAGERPDASGVNWSVRYPDGSVADSFGFFRDPLIPQMVLRSFATAGGPVTLALNASSNFGARGTIRDPKLLAFKLPADADASVVVDSAQIIAADAAPVVVQAATSRPVTTGRAWFTLQTLVGNVVDGMDLIARYEFAVDGAIDYSATTLALAGETHTPAFARLVETSSAIELSATASEVNSDPTAVVEVFETTTLMFRVP